MLIQTYTLDEKNPHVTLKAYLSEIKNPVRDAMLVIPGGGYGCVCADREGDPIAVAFAARGMNAFVLNYTVRPSDPFRPLAEASLAMSFIRAHAEEFSVNPHRVFAVGFSAGAHLAASLGTMWHDEALKERIDIPEASNRPDAMVLCYPVTGFDSHLGSFQNLLGASYENTELRDRFSVDKRVDERTCPAFLIHTAEDQVVPVTSSLHMAEALAAHHIFFELHIYPKGPHGMALADSNTNMGQEALTDSAYARWVDDVVVWTKRLA